MRVLVDDYLNKYDENYLQEHGLDRSLKLDSEILVGAVSEFVFKHDLFSLPETDNYSYGVIDDIISLTDEHERIFYLEFEAIIPADSSISITANIHKDPSHNYRGNYSTNKEIQGYDMATGLGGNLSFVTLTAQVTMAENIEIVDQNFGFDLSEGLTKVDLDLDNEHYYLYVKATER